MPILIIKEDFKGAARIAAQMLGEGKVISFATDTVYGLAADASNGDAVEEIYKLKGRNQNHPISILVKDIEIAKEILLFDEATEIISRLFLPGPLTIILKSSSNCETKICKNLNLKQDGLLGFRVIKSKFIDELFKEFSGILALTSANLSSMTPALSIEQVISYFSDSSLALAVDGGRCIDGVASTVVEISCGNIRLLRDGPIKFSEIKAKIHENF